MPTTITKGLPTTVSKIVINAKGEMVVFYKTGNMKRYPPGKKPSFMKDKKTITTGLPKTVAKVIVHWNDDMTEIMRTGSKKLYKKPKRPSYLRTPAYRPAPQRSPINTLPPIIGNARYIIGQKLANAPADIRQNIIAALDKALDLYNRYASFDKEFTVDYDPSVPTAEVGGDGVMRFGNMFGYRVTLHELGHMFGAGKRWEWQELGKTGVWTGARANALMQTFAKPGDDVTLHCDSLHFWGSLAGGLNQESELYAVPDADVRHVQLVDALSKDMDDLAARQ